MAFPDNCKYTKEHEWIRLESPESTTAYIGITAFAQGELGELVYVEINKAGSKIKAGGVFGAVEAVKTTSDLYMPVDSTILEANPKLDKQPELVNTDPYGEGWIAKVEVADPKAIDGLLDAAAYQELVG